MSRVRVRARPLYFIWSHMTLRALFGGCHQLLLGEALSAPTPCLLGEPLVSRAQSVIFWKAGEPWPPVPSPQLHPPSGKPLAPMSSCERPGGVGAWTEPRLGAQCPQQEQGL